jgi:hypothetical protein
MKFSLKEILYILFSLLKEVVVNAFMPLLTTSIKMSIISLVIYGLINFVPHNIECVKGLTFISCFVAVICVRLFLFRYDDFEEKNDAPLDVNIPNYLKDEEVPENVGEEDPNRQMLQEAVQPPSNIRKPVETDESTRE